MRDLLPEILERCEDGGAVALATVVQTFQSAPRPPGAAMLVTATGDVVGSVSGGCVEGAVYEIGCKVFETGVPQLHRFGVSDGEAFAVGLTCGGTIDIFVERVDQTRCEWLSEVAHAELVAAPIAVTTVVAHPVARHVGRRAVVSPWTTRRLKMRRRTDWIAGSSEPSLARHVAS